MSSFRPGRLVGILVGTIVILGLGVYGPATLLGPLPSVSIKRLTPAGLDAFATAPVLSPNGASAIAVLSATTSDASGTTSTGLKSSDSASEAVPVPLAAAGSSEPLPMASIAKVVTALVVLDAQPFEPAEDGPTVTLTAADFQS